MTEENSQAEQRTMQSCQLV